MLHFTATRQPAPATARDYDRAELTRRADALARLRGEMHELTATVREALAIGALAIADRMLCAAGLAG